MIRVCEGPITNVIDAIVPEPEPVPRRVGIGIIAGNRALLGASSA